MGDDPDAMECARKDLMRGHSRYPWMSARTVLATLSGTLSVATAVTGSGITCWTITTLAQQREEPVHLDGEHDALEDFALGGDRHDLGTHVSAELGEERGDVALDGMRRDKQAIRDLLVGAASSDERQHLPLSGADR